MILIVFLVLFLLTQLQHFDLQDPARPSSQSAMFYWVFTDFIHQHRANNPLPPRREESSKNYFNGSSLLTNPRLCLIVKKTIQATRIKIDFPILKKGLHILTLLDGSVIVEFTIVTRLLPFPLQ